jgi:hypothetical protein
MEFTDEMLKSVYVPGKGMPVYLDERRPQVEDLARELADHHWQPACTTTNKLTRCLEAVNLVRPFPGETLLAASCRLGFPIPKQDSIQGVPSSL